MFITDHTTKPAKRPKTRGAKNRPKTAR